jgi:hypothetical protein
MLVSPGRKDWLALPLLLTAFVALAVLSVRDESIAYDELFHLAGGYSYWQTDDYRIHPTNGNLVQRWLTLPFLVSRPQFPGLDQEDWHFPDAMGKDMAAQFFHDTGNDGTALLRQARLMNLALAVALGVVVYRWSRRLFGGGGGLVSLTLYCLCPTVLAHGTLATSDVAAALSFLLAVAGVWAVLHRLTALTLLGSTLATACLFLVKFSAPLLLPMAGLLVAVRLARGGPLPVAWTGKEYLVRDGWRLGLVFTGAALVQAVVVWALVWACYGFRFSMTAEGQPYRPDVQWFQFLNQPAPNDPRSPPPSRQLPPEPPGLTSRLLQAALTHRLLPEAYLYGQAHTLKFARHRLSYLNGRVSLNGWWYYFPYAFAVKTPLPVAGVLLLAAGTLLRRRPPPGAMPGGTLQPAPDRWHGLYRTAPLWVLIAVYGVAALRTNLNIGVRHLLPLYPPLFILAGAAGAWFRRASWKAAVLLAVLLTWQAWECVRICPDYLSYFNQLAGGPARGYLHLADSNVDWGQGLPALHDWLEAQGLDRPGGPPVFLCYLGADRPSRHGIRAPSLEEYLSREMTLANPFPLRGGVYCVSATERDLGYGRTGGRRWTPEAERDYRTALGGLYRIQSGGRGEQDPNWESLKSALAALEYNRLLAYCRHRPPDALVRYSILVYRLTDAEVQAAMTRPIQEPGLEGSW